MVAPALNAIVRLITITMNYNEDFDVYMVVARFLSNDSTTDGSAESEMDLGVSPPRHNNMDRENNLRDIFSRECSYLEQATNTDFETPVDDQSVIVREFGPENRKKQLYEQLFPNTLKRFNKWWLRNYVGEEIKILAESILVSYDNPSDLEELTEESVKALIMDNRGVIRMAHFFATQARNVFPLRSRSKANQDVVRQHIYRAAKTYGMREHHISLMLDLATTLSFVPSQAQLLARQIDATPAIMERTMVHKGTFWSRGERWVFNWLGDRLRERPFEES
jgi:hypothetical protein